MKELKAILALILVACLFVTLFAACAKNDEQPTTNNQPSTENNQNADKSTDSQQPDADEEVEITDVIFWVFDDRGTGGANQDRIESAMNAITEPEGVHVDLNYLSFGDYTTKVQLAISGGDRIDVLGLLLNSSISNLRTNNMARDDITDIYKTYAADALKVVEDYMGPYTGSDGTIYGLPTQRAHIGGTYWLFNAEVAEELGLTETIKGMTRYSELEEVLATVQKARPDWYAIAPYQNYGVIPTNGGGYGGDLFSDSVVFDNLGDSTNMVYTTSDGKVSLLPATDTYLDSVKLSADWFNKGYVWPDGLYNNSEGNSNLKQKVSFAMMMSSEGSATSVAATKSALCGYEILAIEPEVKRMMRTSSVNFWGISVPITCDEPIAACKFINMLYTNSELMNIFVHGEEGIDYEVQDGQAVHYEGAYAEGNYVVGNNFLTWPVSGAGADHWDYIHRIHDSAEISPFMGFLIDTADLQLYISQITAVNDQYSQTLLNGGYTEALYQEYLDKLADAEVQAYLDSVQKQLDAWIAAQ